MQADPSHTSTVVSNLVNNTNNKTVVLSPVKYKEKHDEQNTDTDTDTDMDIDIIKTSWPGGPMKLVLGPKLEVEMVLDPMDINKLMEKQDAVTIKELIEDDIRGGFEEIKQLEKEIKPEIKLENIEVKVQAILNLKIQASKELP